jgi:NAD(P)-dependent dehydrogenase (short-subunit alcohol dehydrogenase family)
MRFKDKVAIVTGGGSGIGEGAVRRLHREGATVVIADIRPEAAQAVADDLGDPARAIVREVNVLDNEALAALVDESAARFGRLDLLVNNAGMSAPAVPIDELDVGVWNQVVGANLTGAFLCTRAAFGQMKRQEPQGGRIINNGSISATTPRPHSAPYTATKHAITGLTKASALDGRPFNIACGQIDIGNAGTAMTSRMAKGVLQADGSTAIEPTIDSDLIGEAVGNMADLPLSANVLTMTIMATQMPFVGRG